MASAICNDVLIVTDQISESCEELKEQSRRVGLYVHYSETHDNERLAKLGREWSLLRNRLCALTCVSGGFGFTNGVEVISVTDDAWATGAPGMGFNFGVANTNVDHGFRSYQVDTYLP